jgi:excinuclease UvrABC ATPase subunit
MKHSVRRLRDAGNTVLLVEHHREMIGIADHVVDMGPGPGSEGGEIIFEGSYDELLSSGTDTGRMLKASTDFKSETRPVKDSFRLAGATLHNLKNVDIDLPLNLFCVVAGVAGSGKSSLMEAFMKARGGDDMIYVSQKSIGISLRSTPATYMDVADQIRKMFAKANKKQETYFAFNGKGACPVCGGKGVVIAEMAFMDSIETVCEACKGLRYSPEALEYHLESPRTRQKLNIAQVMDLSVRKASEFFKGTQIEERLRPMMDVGLGYLHLNQALSTLSGGELQRLKIASYLKEKGKIFIIDEPTDGLHPKDVHNLVMLFEKMVEQGNSIYVIEHNTDVIKSADYVIELGPGAGEDGGEITFCGTPRKMKDCMSSATAAYL